MFQIKPVRNTVLKVGTMLLVSTYLSGGKMDMKNMQNTLIGFAISNIVGQLLKEQIVKMDEKIGYQVMGDVVGVTVMSVVTAMLKGNKINRAFVMKTGFTIAGFTLYNIFGKERVNKLPYSNIVLDVIHDALKPTTMIMASTLFAGGNPVEPQNLRKILFTVMGFLSYTIALKPLL
jgi:hypothetical protein